jgi:hypothetical protein
MIWLVLGLSIVAWLVVMLVLWLHRIELDALDRRAVKQELKIKTLEDWRGRCRS